MDLERPAPFITDLSSLEAVKQGPSRSVSKLSDQSVPFLHALTAMINGEHLINYTLLVLKLYKSSAQNYKIELIIFQTCCFGLRDLILWGKFALPPFGPRLIVYLFFPLVSETAPLASSSD